MSEGPKLITHSDPKSPISEAYRILRTNIQFAGLDKPLKRVAITSSIPGEGKSTTMANLGVTMAQAGTKVIIVNADLRRPFIGKLFGLSEHIGLTTVLMGRVSLDEVIMPTAVPNLFVLPSGPIPPNPSELLGSQAMANLLAELDKKADIVLIDCPPVIAVADTAILAPKVDGIILLARIGHVPKDLVLKTKANLEAAKARILGVVASRVKIQGSHNYYYYYYYSEDKKPEGKGTR